MRTHFKIYESKLFIPLKRDPQDRETSKTPSVEHKNKNNWSTFNQLSTSNVALKTSGISVIDIDHIQQNDLTTIYKHINEHQLRVLVGETYDVNDNTYGIHIIYKDERNTTPNGTEYVTLSGHNCDLRSGDGAYVALQMVDFEGNRLEKAASKVWHGNQLGEEDLDTIKEMPAFQVVKRSKVNSESREIVWVEGSRNESSMQYAASLFNGIEDLTLQQAMHYSKYIKMFHPSMETYEDSEWEATWKDIFRKYNRSGRRDNGKSIWRSSSDKFIPHKFIDHIEETLEPKLYRNVLYIYDHDRNIYIKGERVIKNKFHQLDNLLTTSNTQETYKKLYESLHPHQTSNEWSHLLNTKTKTLNILNNEEVEQELPLYRLRYDYNPKAFDQEVETYLTNISQNNEELRGDILRGLATGMVPKHYRRIIIYKGIPGSGKSTLMDLFNSIWDNNTDDTKVYSTVDVTKVEKDQFLLKKMRDSLYNISPEAPKATINSSNVLKAISGGDDIDVRIMNSQEDISGKIYSTIFMTSNNIVKFNDKSGGMESRVVNIPIEYVPPVVDTNYKDKLITPEGIEYLTRLLIEELVKIGEEQPQFTSQLTIDLQSETEHEGRPLHAFIKDNYPIDKIEGMVTEDLHHELFGSSIVDETPLKESLGESEWIRTRQFNGTPRKLTQLVLNEVYPNLTTKAMHSQLHGKTKTHYIRKENI